MSHVKKSLREKIAQRGHLYPPFFTSRGKQDDTFDVLEAIKVVSRNRKNIPDRYWDNGGVLRLATEETKLQGGELISNFLLKGKEGETCRLTASSDGYSDVYDCPTAQFAEALRPLRWTRDDLDRLKELFVLVKDDLKIADLIWCKNMEVRRDTIKRMDYQEVRRHARVLDTYKDYELLDLAYGSMQFGRFLKMIDSTSKNVYLLHVPATRDFGSVKIPLNKCKDALAWSYEVQASEYKPEIET